MTAVDVLFDSSSIAEVRAQVLGLIPIFDRVAAATKGATQRAAKEHVATEAAAGKAIVKDAENTEKEKVRAAKDAAREKERIAKDAQRAESQFLRAGMAAITSAENERTRLAEQEANKRKRIAEQEADAVKATIKRRSNAFGSLMGGATGRVMGMAGRVAGVAAALGGGFTIADALGSGIRNEAAAGQIARSAQEKGGITGAQLDQKARATAIAFGTRSDDVLRGIDAFVQKTGNLKEAVNLVDELGLEAASSGAKIEDLGSTSAEVFSAVGNVAGTKDVMRTLIGQGKAGAVDIRNLAQYGARLTSTAGLFEGDVGENIKTFGSLAQVAKAKGGATDAAEATEAAARLFDEIATHKDQFEASGVKVKGEGGKLRNVPDILLDTLVKNKGDITEIPHLLGRQAGKVEIGLAQAFLEGTGGKTDTASLEKGRSRASELIQSYQKPVTDGELRADLSKRLAENDAKLNQATEELHRAIGDKLLPLLPSLIEKFTQLIPTLQHVIDFFTAGTLGEGIAKAVGIAFAAEIGKGAISLGANALFTKIGASFLGLFSSQKTAVANITAGVVNVGGAGGAGEAVKDIVKTGGGAAAPEIAAGMGLVGAAGTIAGMGVGAVGAGILLGFDYLGDRRAKEGSDAYASVMSLPTDTDEQKRAKIAALEGADKAGKAGNRFHEVALHGDDTDMRNFPGGIQERSLGSDRKSQELGKHIDAMESEIVRLKQALSDAANGVVAFGDAMKPPPGLERPEVPQPGIRNREQ